MKYISVMYEWNTLIRVYDVRRRSSDVIATAAVKLCKHTRELFYYIIILTCRPNSMNIHPANISGADVVTAYLRPIRSISHPAGTAMAKLPMSMHATIHDICVDVSDRGARPVDMYSMTGDGHPSTIPAMNTGNDAAGMREK